MNPGYDMGNATPPTACDLMCGLQDSDNLPDDESLMLAPAIVYGFAFSIKQWGCFPLIGFSKISFDDHAFDRHLVMSDEVQKRMLLGLVSQYLQDPEETENVGRGNNTTEFDVVQSIDPISNKGEGCIFLCYGPTGTGKTLTTKSVAEKLHRPLWAISASEKTPRRGGRQQPHQTLKKSKKYKGGKKRHTMVTQSTPKMPKWHHSALKA
jgi:hypothetical protein